MSFNLLDGYAIYFNYNNDAKVYQLPVLPEEISVTYKGQTTSMTLDKFGEAVHKGKRDGATIKFSSFFPDEYTKSLCRCKKKKFKDSWDWNQWMLKLMQADKPCHFVVAGSPLAINMYADIVSYTASEAGGDVGAINYTVELKEHRNPQIKEFKKSKKKKTTKSSTKKERPSNKEDTNQMKVNCSALHFRSGPNGKILGTMKRGATLTTDGKKKGNWVHVCYNGKWGYAYKSYLKDA